MTSRRTVGDWIGLVARGFAMGAADVVPGVSGGTMAFILGIYEELIDATKRFTEPPFWRHLLSFRIREALEDVSWRFLLSVLSGILLAVFSLAPFLEWALENQPARLWAFFFGLVIASIFTVRRRLPGFPPRCAVAALLGAIAAWLIVGLVPVTTPDANWFLVLSGAIAICAMMLPGISGSFILVLMGKYRDILAAVSDRELGPLIFFSFGAGLGLLSFVRLLSWLLRRFHDLTVSILLGLMAGSLRKVWPWKETTEYMLDRHGESVPMIQVNILPLPGTDVLTPVLLAVAGIGLVLVLASLEGRVRE